MTSGDLREWRVSAGLDQTDLATRLGLSPRQYQALEAGSSPVRRIHVLALATVAAVLADEARERAETLRRVAR